MLPNPAYSLDAHYGLVETKALQGQKMPLFARIKQQFKV